MKYHVNNLEKNSNRMDVEIGGTVKSSSAFGLSSLSHPAGFVLNKIGSLRKPELFERFIKKQPAILSYCNFLEEGFISDSLFYDNQNVTNKLEKVLRCVAQNQLIEADDIFAEILNEQPNFWEIYQYKAIILTMLSRIDQAVSCLQRARELCPNQIYGLNNLAKALHDRGLFDEATHVYQAALNLAPTDYLLNRNFAFFLLSKRDLSHANTLLNQMSENNVDSLDLKKGKIMTLFFQDDLQNGFRKFCKTFRRQFPNEFVRFSQPYWGGRTANGDLAQKSILVCEGENADFGFGDMIQLSRYIVWLKNFFKNVFVECRPQLYRLMTSLSPDINVFAKGDPIPNFDLHVLVSELPLIHKTSLSTIPQSSPYLFASREHFPDIELSSELYNIGFALTGASQRVQNPLRSCPLKNFLPLFFIEGSCFYNLQRDESINIGQEGDTALSPIVNIQDKLGDFAVMAAIIDRLDLVITVDTAVAHLAGAIGKPVLLMLSYDADWRWLLNRSDSPWYPTIKIFRCPSPNDWDAVVRNISDHVAALRGKKNEGKYNKIPSKSY